MRDSIRLMTGKVLMNIVPLLLLLVLPARAEYQVDNDVVTDTGTGLMWMKGDAGLMAWQAALAWCQESNHQSYSDWRLPDIYELESLIDYGAVDPAIDPVFNCQSANYWSSSPYAGNSGGAWAAYFHSGYANHYGKGGTGYVRCVRSGP